MIFVLVVTQWYWECIGVPHAWVINLIMDGEDILDNFSDEEEIDAGVAAPRRRKVLFYTLEKKRQIVNEAFSAPRMVKPTARKWSVQPTQIRKWRQQMQQDAALPAYPYPRTVEERTIVKTHKLVKTRNEGRPTTTPNDLLQQLLPYIEGLRERGNAVSTTTVTLELLRMAPDLLNVGFVPLRRRVLRFLKKHHYTFRVVTHKAQNHRYHAMVIDDWVGHINRLIVASAYTEHSVVNFDETNVDFNPSHRNTLCKIGEKSISLRINGHSGRCTVMLGCSAGGHKFPPFIIWKGVRGGRIHRDCGMQVFEPGQMYTVQPSGWMDGQAFNEWVRRVIQPYVAARDNSVLVLLDNFSVHMQHDNVTSLQILGAEVEFIPAGYTPILQAMDKGLHKPFKQYLREESLNWMVQQPDGTKPTRQHISQWISRAWAQVQLTTILNTWQAIGIRPVNNN